MDNNTLLHRQAHPNFLDSDKPTSQVFTPFPKDNGELSVDDGSKVTAEESHRHYTTTRKLTSASVWAVTVEEASKVGTPAASSPNEDNPAHAHLDFNSEPTKSEPTDSELAKTHRKLAKKLKIKAIARGCQYLPPLPTE